MKLRLSIKQNKMRPGMIPPNKKMAEQMFGQKASPDANLSPKEFLAKHPIGGNWGSMFMRGLRASAKVAENYGKNVVGGAEIVGGTLKKGITKRIVKFIGDTPAGEKLKEGLKKQKVDY